MISYNRAIIIVLDSCGCGFLDDADEYGDLGANTLGHIGEAVGLNVPNMESLGLGKIIPIRGVDPNVMPLGAYGKAKEKSKGKDTTTGHWEIAGVITNTPFPLYPNGFPDEIIKEFERRTGRKALGNKPASGTAIIDEYGEEHIRTGNPIVYTSGDSVFQIAAHEEVIKLEELYKMCEIAREITNVGRVIARPFVGKPGNFQRTANRHDYSLEPPQDTLLDIIKKSNMDVIAIGKIFDIFAGRGITKKLPTHSNAEGIELTLKEIQQNTQGLIFTNLVDFDMKYGHRRDVKGYKNALEYFDKELKKIIESLKDTDILFITADHGCDPIFKGTDHTREHIPILVYSKYIRAIDIGTRESFSDISSTILELLLNKENNNSFAKLIS